MTLLEALLALAPVQQLKEAPFRAPQFFGERCENSNA